MNIKRGLVTVAIVFLLLGIMALNLMCLMGAPFPVSFKMVLTTGEIVGFFSMLFYASAKEDQ